MSNHSDYPAVGLIGIETEYGVTRDGLSEIDHVTESMELVRAYLDQPFRRQWSYRGENPHRDARGFSVDRLEQDEEEDEFVAREASRKFSFADMKSDLVLANGARFYNDHTHPEYSTPECRSLRDLVAHDRAGEAIVWEAVRRRNQRLAAEGQPGDVSVYKNNTDFHGHSYGCHDNYLMPRRVPFERIAAGLIPFLISRQVFAGAGKVGVESGNTHRRNGFQLSQRADFVETELSVNTMHNRPIVNTRDEPHADPARFRRLHLILGDANMCEYATTLKVGTTRAVLELIARNAAPDVAVAKPVFAVRTMSSDPELKATVELRDGRRMNGLELQQVYLEAAQRHLAGVDPETDWLLGEWESTLMALSGDRSSLRGRIDWITKRWLLETFAEDAYVAWDDPWLTSLDLAYHHLDPERGLLRGLEAEGTTTRVASSEAVDRAVREAPSDTRAAIRGLCVARFGNEVESIQWERITATNGAVLDLNSLVDPDDVAHVRAVLREAPSLSDAIRAVQQPLAQRGHA
ncbi:MAG: proteasome accessory factor PafA2 family protein [Nitrospirota bacterium]